MKKVTAVLLLTCLSLASFAEEQKYLPIHEQCHSLISKGCYEDAHNLAISSMKDELSDKDKSEAYFIVSSVR